MIDRHMVLVLGAGASKPYNFPVGRELLERVVERLEPDGGLRPQLRSCGCEDRAIDDFHHELVRAQQPSVDAFLERRPEFIEIGKLAIAAELVFREQERILFPTFKGFQGHERRWYDYLFGMMVAPSPDKFADNKLSVITFNYDRSFEHALFLFIKHNYHLPDEAAEERLRAVPVVHVYGQLGGPRYRPAIPPADRPIPAALLSQVAAGIKVVHERGQGDREFAEAHGLLEKAELVCFLGFAYHEDNVARLRLDRIPKTAPLYGTTFGLGGAEQDRVQKRIGRHIYLSEWDALDFLREEVLH